MPNYNVRAFSNGPNNMRSASDFINRKRAETRYTVAASNVQTITKNNNSNVPIKVGNCNNSDCNKKSLSSVGGYNVNSYDLLLDITKGKYYTAVNGRNITLSSDGQPIHSDIYKPVYTTNCNFTKIYIHSNNYYLSSSVKRYTLSLNINYYSFIKYIILFKHVLM